MLQRKLLSIYQRLPGFEGVLSHASRSNQYHVSELAMKNWFSTLSMSCSRATSDDKKRFLSNLDGYDEDDLYSFDDDDLKPKRPSLRRYPANDDTENNQAYKPHRHSKFNKRGTGSQWTDNFTHFKGGRRPTHSPMHNDFAAHDRSSVSGLYQKVQSKGKTFRNFLTVEKNFYGEHPDITSRDVDEIQEFQDKYEISIAGSQKKRPSFKFQEVCFPDARYEEAMIAVKKAKQLATSGNKKLASKLFQHALALEPEFADALTGYGEFLEGDNNIIEADLLYQRALTCEPSHITALANRERTMPVVEELDKRLLSEIDLKKSELYKYPPHSKVLRRAMKEFYYEHIYNTVAIEGNTLTIGEVKEIVNSRNGIAGRSLYEHNEVIGVDKALKYLNSTLLLKYGAIAIDQIKELHKRIIGFVDPVKAGIFRSNQVYVGNHIPPHPDEVPGYMEEFGDWLNSEKSLNMHPAEFAAVAHYKLVHIHPFIDGNGRTSRLFMNMILMKNGFPPVSIQVGDQWVYYETLEAADRGDLRPFIRFIARCISLTLDGYLLAAEDLP